MSWIKYVIEGLGALFFGWLRERKAEEDRDKARSLEAFVSADAEADKVEKELPTDAAKAAASAPPDFTAIR